jgi:translation elongation factor P/translation initiation factor 5A
MEQHELEYLYSVGSHHHFMTLSHTQQVLLRDERGTWAECRAQWLTPGCRFQAEFF